MWFQAFLRGLGVLHVLHVRDVVEWLPGDGGEDTCFLFFTSTMSDH
jgi:hypothetical protein